MADQTHAARNIIRATIEEWTLPADNLNGRDIDVLAERIDRALFGDRVPSERVGPRLSAEELAAILRHDLWTEAEQAALVRHLEAQDATIAAQNTEMDRLTAEVERMAAGNERLVAEVRRLLFLYTCAGSTDIERRSSIGIDQCPLIAELLTPARPEGT